MKDYKTIVRFSCISIMELLRNVVFWLVLIVVSLVLLYLCGDVGAYLRESGDQMNLFEIYIWFHSIRQSRVIYLVGLILLLCGVTFFNKGASYYLLRINRRIWVISQLFYLFAVVVVYNLVTLAVFWVGCKGAVSVVGEWSRAAFIACQFGVEYIGLGTTFYAIPHFLAFNPNLIGIVTLALQILIGVIVGMTLLAFQSKGKIFIGIIVVLAFWFGEVMLMENFGYPVLGYLTPFRLSMPSQIGFGGTGPSAIYACSYFVVLFIVLESLLLRLSKQVDFLKME